jgi:hypothetical protein
MKKLNNYISEALRIKPNTKFTSNEKPENIYFYHEAIKNGYATRFENNKDNVLFYSIDNCKTWEILKPFDETPQINKGERIYFKGNSLKIDTIKGIGTFSSNNKFNIGGNLLSILFGDDFKKYHKLEGKHQFKELFNVNYGLVSAKNLKIPVDALTDLCFTRMFADCIFLTEAPELPCEKLANECYTQMFSGCKRLKKAPILPAQELTYGCYYGMFEECIALEELTILGTDIAKSYAMDWILHHINTNGTLFHSSKVNFNQIWGKIIPKNWTLKEI